jgi:DNA invertase Pin-like site-specific DNA recombinase
MEAVVGGGDVWDCTDGQEWDPCAMLADIRLRMEQNVNTRRTLKERRRVEYTKTVGEWARQDSQVWYDQLDALEEQGIDDITIGKVRISDKGQLEGMGPDDQRRLIISWVVAQQFAGKVSERGVDIWVFDVESGLKDSHEGIEFIRHAVERGIVKNVVVARLDRWCRNQWLSEEMARVFKKTYTKLCSASEHLPSGPFGDLMRQILQAFAQYEASVIVQRMSGGKTTAIKTKGVYNGGEVPYGYLAQGTRGDTGKGVLTICESEARVIRLIFRLWERGYSQTAIARALNRWGIPTRHGGQLGWRQSLIRRIVLAEPQYRAEALFSRKITDFEKIAHEPILPHRADSAERTYMANRASLLSHGAQVPDDLFGPSVPMAPKPNTVNKFTHEQGRMLATMFALRDEGLTQKEICKRLEAMGLRSLEGRVWKQSNLHNYLQRRELYERTLSMIGDITPYALGAPVPTAVAASRAAIDRAGMEQTTIAYIKQLRAGGFSMNKITEKLAVEGHTTAAGARWSVSAVERVIKGHKRRTELAVEAP